MESLKKLEEICQPDVRQHGFVRLDLNTPKGFRKLTLEDFHQAAADISLHDGVPETIRSHFQTARNLIIYSWFYYPFNMTAQLCAYTTVEFALRIKDGNSSSYPSFRRLLKKAVEQKWIWDKGFSHVRQKHENMRAYNERLPEEWKFPERELLQDYCTALTESFPYLRNCLAHGSSMLHNHGASTVRICADLINQLFPCPPS